MSEIIKLLIELIIEMFLVSSFFELVVEAIADSAYISGKNSCYVKKEEREQQLDQIETVRKLRKKFGKYAMVFTAIIFIFSQYRGEANREKQEFMFYQGVAAVIGDDIRISDWKDDLEFAYDNLEDWIEEKTDENYDRPSYWERLF